MFKIATQVDAEEIAALVNRAYRPNANERGWTHEADLVSGARINTAQVNALIDSHGVILLADDGTHIIGCVHIKPAVLSCYIGMLAVQPSHQNNGLGKKILAAAEAFATLHYAVTSYKMSVLSSRPELLAYYERLGYQLTGVSSPYPIDASVGQPRSFDLHVLDLIKNTP